MKDRILTNTARTLRRSFPRFVSLLVMSMLGVFAFAGLQATSPDMLRTLDDYLDSHDTYDIRVMSDMGLCESDLEALEALDGVLAVEGVYYSDVLLRIGENETVVAVSSMPDKINRLTLIEGRLPAYADEIVVEANLLSKNGMSLGDTLTLGDGFRKSVVTIVGTVDSSLYYKNSSLTQDRGNTSVGTGKISYYAYLLPSAFERDYFTSIYLTVESAASELTGSGEYLELVSEVYRRVEQISDTRESERYRELYSELEDKIYDERDLAYAECDKASGELSEALEALKEARERLDSSAADIAEAEAELARATVELDAKRAEYDAALASLGLEAGQVAERLDELSRLCTELESKLKAVEESIPASIPPEQYPSVPGYSELVAQIAQLKGGIAALEQLRSAGKAIDEAQSVLDTSLTELEKGRAEYAKGLSEYEENERAYRESEAELEKSRVEIDDATDKALAELDDTLHRPTWYIYDRTDDATYTDYIDDAGSIANLSKIFPAVFFAVAVLVSLISMNRMVEEERGEIGTLKSLGFPGRRIMAKYLIFSLSATALGGLIGAIGGLIVLPTMIFGIYKILFDVPGLYLGLNPVSTLVGFLITVVCVVGTSLLTAYNELRAKPSELMRPKAPKGGKRVFLENIGFIWHRISFSQKVTIRNLFRYKKRVLVTVGGIAGCTALMLCGFGIRDSITDIPTEQFENIYHFDATVYVRSADDEAYRGIFGRDGIAGVALTERRSATVDGFASFLFVAKDAEELSSVVELCEVGGDGVLSPERGTVIITDKLSALTGLGAGDEIEVVDVDRISYRFRISGVVKNYIEHYIYVDRETFEAAGGTFEPNVAYLKLDGGVDRDALSEGLLGSDDVLGVGYTSALIDSADDMLGSLGSVVMILIVLASLLAFVVLYNLSNININERRREIATLKVLGFYDKEVDSYINKETVILTVLGIAIGLTLGRFLTFAVIATVEIEKCRFIYLIKWQSYVFSAALAVLFTLIVNRVTHFKLKAINMIDSLKSVE